MKSKELEIAITTYTVAYKKGYTQCQEDMADKKYTEEDMYNCWQTAFTDAMNIREKDYKPIWFSDFINSLNKQD
jgi:hypothetical protein